MSAEVGTTDALHQDMMPQLIETLGSTAIPHCTREQARELLEGLRAAYQTLPRPEQALIRSMVAQLGREHAHEELV